MFTGKVALVTGGGSGIGRAVARQLALQGATVMITGRDDRALKETADNIKATGGQADWLTTDVTDEAQVADLITTTTARHGGLHVAVNNAGVLGPAGIPTADLDRKAFTEVMDINLMGTWLCMKHEIAYMRTNGGGTIVNVASNIGAHSRRPGLAAYAASKAAVSALTRTAALDHVADGIRINAVSPGATATSMSRRPGESDADRDDRLAGAIPLGRVGATDEVAAAVLWLASPASAFTVGHDLVLDGGATA
ncbi:glucose 1-dehydrogenase [Saccharothrix violaceirubra]|uniref:NAD(P)-dependent dehydrogenase (Short-subunit alcohol dehydrogenase family) n=1 Tax=Saccharothrix violaceirubra TaxID=413306 RepID=A0A7W7T4F4_9PSEU|nr:glucose 1-dehydrogenase [Saccharothrix violaceirubra]MBB4965130.1 NAD(P)-dependent dehydrogenase (short-subunit alcohol dehydrogenase family) [Saccharothrix violaceirubra]